MSLKLNIIIIFIIFQVFSISTISVTTASSGDVDSPKIASVGSNSGNISSNAAGGRFYFNLTIVSGTSYNFILTGDSGTKFDLFFFDSSFYPTIILDESTEFIDTNSYPVKLEGYTTTNSWAFIMVFSNHVDGGIGDFTLSISDPSTQTSSSSTPIGSTTNTSDDVDSPGFDIITGVYAILILSATLNVKRRKFNY